MASRLQVAPSPASESAEQSNAPSESAGRARSLTQRAQAQRRRACALAASRPRARSTCALALSRERLLACLPACLRSRSLARSRSLYARAFLLRARARAFLLRARMRACARRRPSTNPTLRLRRCRARQAQHFATLGTRHPGRCSLPMAQPLGIATLLNTT